MYRQHSSKRPKQIHKLFQRHLFDQEIIITGMPKIYNDVADYKLTKFQDVKTKLNAAKSSLDKYFADEFISKEFQQITAILDLYRPLRYHIANTYNAQVVTNAWLKCYEMVSYYKLINDNTRDNNEDVDDNNIITAFCNAELPGGFICAINQFIETMMNNDAKFNWRASSLVIGNDTENRIQALGDVYNLWKCNPDNWLMSVNVDDANVNNKTGSNSYINNGDVTSYDNLVDIDMKIREFADNGVDLYTHDLGIDVSDDFNEQELKNAYAHFGAAVAGLMTLKPGGCFIAKQYTFFETFTVNLIIIYASMFNDFYICKPLTSRPGNSEIYLVGKGFREYPQAYRDIFEERLKHFNTKPFIPQDELPPDTLHQIYEFLNKIYSQQIDFLNENVEMYEKYNGKVYILRNGLKQLKRQRIHVWEKTYPLRRISDNELIDTKCT